MIEISDMRTIYTIYNGIKKVFFPQQFLYFKLLGPNKTNDRTSSKYYLSGTGD